MISILYPRPHCLQTIPFTAVYLPPPPLPGLLIGTLRCRGGDENDNDNVKKAKLGSLSNNVFERRTSTGSGLFSFFDGGFAQIFSQIASITVKKLRNINFISSRHVKRENTSLPVDVRRSKTLLLKLPIIRLNRQNNTSARAARFSVYFF